MYFWPFNDPVNVIIIINCMLIFQSSNLFSPLTLFVDDNGQRQATTMMNYDNNDGDEGRRQRIGQLVGRFGLITMVGWLKGTIARGTMV